MGIVISWQENVDYEAVLSQKDALAAARLLRPDLPDATSEAELLDILGSLDLTDIVQGLASKDDLGTSVDDIEVTRR